VIGFTIGNSTLNVLDNRGYHDSIESHPLDIIELVDCALPCPSTIETCCGVAW
jgi:hypothetical protein